MYLHNVHVLGRATTDVELKKSKSDKSYAKFSVAVNQKTQDEKENTYYYEILFFGKRAEAAAERVKKKDVVFVIGRPEYEAYVSKKTEEAKYNVTVLADYWYVAK